MPNLPETEQMLQRLQQQKKMMEQRQAQQAQGGTSNPALEGRISVMEQKLDRLLNHLGVKTNDIKPPVQKAPVVNNPPRKVPAPPANSKPPKKKRNKSKKGK